MFATNVGSGLLPQELEGLNYHCKDASLLSYCRLLPTNYSILNWKIVSATRTRRTHARHARHVTSALYTVLSRKCNKTLWIGYQIYHYSQTMTLGISNRALIVVFWQGGLGGQYTHRQSREASTRLTKSPKTDLKVQWVRVSYICKSRKTMTVGTTTFESNKHRELAEASVKRMIHVVSPEKEVSVYYYYCQVKSSQWIMPAFISAVQNKQSDTFRAGILVHFYVEFVPCESRSFRCHLFWESYS